MTLSPGMQKSSLQKNVVCLEIGWVTGTTFEAHRCAEWKVAFWVFPADEEMWTRERRRRWLFGRTIYLTFEEVEDSACVVKHMWNTGSVWTSLSNIQDPCSPIIHNRIMINKKSHGWTGHFFWVLQWLTSCCTCWWGGYLSLTPAYSLTVLQLHECHLLHGAWSSATGCH